MNEVFYEMGNCFSRKKVLVEKCSDMNNKDIKLNMDAEIEALRENFDNDRFNRLFNYRCGKGDIRTDMNPTPRKMASMSFLDLCCL